MTGSVWSLYSAPVPSLGYGDGSLMIDELRYHSVVDFTVICLIVYHTWLA